MCERSCWRMYVVWNGFKMKRCKMVSMAKVVVGGQDDKSYVVTILMKF